MSIIFRRMSMEDVESVWRMFQDIREEKIDMSFAEISSIEEVTSYVDNPSELTYVAVSEEDPHTVLCLITGKREMTEEKKHAVFLSAATARSARGRGLVSILTDYALNEMEHEGITIARIYVYSNNISSIKAIQKMDFTHAGTVLMHHKDRATGEFVDDLIFHKILNLKSKAF